MFQGSATDELDRLIASARSAQDTIAGLFGGISPDDNGVVTTTVDVAAAGAADMRGEVEQFEKTGLAVASLIDDLYPETAGSYRELADLTQRIRESLDHQSIGHTIADLSPGDTGDPIPDRAETADESSSPSYY